MTYDARQALLAAVQDYLDALVETGLVAAKNAPDLSEVTPVPPPAELVHLFGGEVFPDELTYLHGLGERLHSILPAEGRLLSWPTNRDYICGLFNARALPFDWRRQIPVVAFDKLYDYTVVCDESHFGEVWYVSGAEDSDEVFRVSESLPLLFRDWAQLVRADLLSMSLQQLSKNNFRQAAGLWPQVNVLASSMWDRHEDVDFIRQRQQECGIDLQKFHDNDCMLQTLDEWEVEQALPVSTPLS